MTSEESVTTTSTDSSRLKQFRLYRTIDARTEEFLKASKKRQIRQGCACAAVSTAITVTVVISVLLVYEYNISIQSNRNIISSSSLDWINLMNDSSEVTPLEEKYKTNINLDKTTLKILPLIIKTLHQNRYLEKIIDNTPNQSKEKDSTEFTYQKNIFSNAKNWVRMPNSRLYTIEYKSSPIIIYKKSTKTSDYFTKIRKIRDYQRMLDYFDKMISAKVGIGYTLPLKKEYDHTEASSLKLSTHPMKKHTKTEKLENKRNNLTIKTALPVTKNVHHCKCPSKLNGALIKLVSSIQKLLPELAERNKLHYLANCWNESQPKTKKIANVSSSSVTTSRVKPVTTPSYFRTTSQFISTRDSLSSKKNYLAEDNSLLYSNIPLTTVRSTSQFISTRDPLYNTKHYLIKGDSRSFNIPSTTPRRSSIMNFFQNFKTQQARYDTFEETSTATRSLDATVAFHDKIPTTTKPMTTEDQELLDTTTDKSSTPIFKENLMNYKNLRPTTFKQLIEKANESDTFDKLNINDLDSKLLESTGREHQTVPVFNEDEYEDDFMSTTSSNIINELFDKLDIQSLELIKTNIISKHQRKFNKTTTKPPNRFSPNTLSTSEQITHSTSFRKQGKPIQTPIPIDEDNLKSHINLEQFKTVTPNTQDYELTRNLLYNYVKNYSDNLNNKKDANNHKSYILHNNQKDTESSLQSKGETERNISEYNDNINNKKEDVHRNEEKIINSDDIYKTIPGYEFEYNNSKQTFSPTKSPVTSTNQTTTKYMYKYPSSPPILKPLKDILDKKHSTNQMTRHQVNHPLYLEMQRNYWKQDDHQDYDLNTFD